MTLESEWDTQLGPWEGERCGGGRGSLPAQTCFHLWLSLVTGLTMLLPHRDGSGKSRMLFQPGPALPGRGHVTAPCWASETMGITVPL